MHSRELVGVALFFPSPCQRNWCYLYVYDYVNLLLVDYVCENRRNANTVVGLFTHESCEYFAADDDKAVAVDFCTGLYPLLVWQAIPSPPLNTYT